VVGAVLAALKDSDNFVRRAAARTLGSAAAGDAAVVGALLAALKDSDSDVRGAAAGALGSAAAGDAAVVGALVNQVWRYGRADPFADALSNALEGRQLPGFRWKPISERRRRREVVRKFFKGGGIGLAIGLALYFGGSWFAALPDTDPIKKLLKAIPAISTVLGLGWALFLVIRGEKRTIW
jgi:hypothetical protein